MSIAFVESFIEQDQPMKKIEQRTGYVRMVPSEYGNRNNVSTENLYFQGYTPTSLGSRSIPVDKVASWQIKIC